MTNADPLADLGPDPTPPERRRGEKLVAHIRDVIGERQGTIPFFEYMALALYAPDLGYYSADHPIFGPAGDFVTAPETSPLFGQCLARQVAEVLEALGEGIVLEAGAGSGRLAATLLAELDRLGVPPGRYQILEPSPALRRRQAALIAALAPGQASHVEWLDALPATGFRGVVLANEVLDALPAARFRATEGGWEEWGVTWREGAFRWTCTPPATAGLTAALEALAGASPAPLPAGYASEVGLGARAFTRAVGECLERGAALFIDYGYPAVEYYHPQRVEGTLRCHYRHRTHGNPLVLTGLQDISVHVDFTAVAECARSCGLAIAGFTTQAEFLFSTGLLHLAAGLDPNDSAYPARAAEIKRLTLPGEMGDAIKVMALVRDCTSALSGFRGRDHRHRL